MDWGMKGRVGMTNKQFCTEQTAKGTHQNDNGARRQISVCELRQAKALGCAFIH